MQQLRNSSGQLIGLMEDAGNQINVRTAGGVLLGWYIKHSDRTFKANGVAVGSGNLLASLL